MPIFDLLDTVFGFGNSGNTGALNSNRSRRRPTRSVFSNERGDVLLQQNQPSEAFLQNVLSQLGVAGADEAQVNRVIAKLRADPAALDESAKGDAGTTRNATQRPAAEPAQETRQATDEQALLDRSLQQRRTQNNNDTTATSTIDRLEALLERFGV